MLRLVGREVASACDKPAKPMRFRFGAEPPSLYRPARLVQSFADDVLRPLTLLARLDCRVLLELTGCAQEHVDALGNSSRVCECISEISIRHGTLTNTEALKGIPRVSLTQCHDLRDAQGLGAAEVVTVEDCPVRDVSGFAGVKNLHLIDCTEITSIADLGGQRVLTIDKCPGISDFKSVAKVPLLTILHSGLTELFEAENDTLRLYSCPLLTDVGKIVRVRCLILSGCPNVATGLCSLSRVTDTLSIARLTDLSMLRASHIIITHSAVADISHLRYATSVSLCDCPNVVDVSALRDAQHVYLYQCGGIKDVTPLRNVKSLYCLRMDAADCSKLGAHYSLSITNKECKPPYLYAADCRELRHCYRVTLNYRYPIATAGEAGELARVRHRWAT